MKQAFLTAIVFLACNAGAHEGDSPGALPAPPNGGKIAEAIIPGSTSDAEGVLELYLEAKIDGTKIKIYPLNRDPKNPKVFIAAKPSPQLVLSELKVEQPRSKKTATINPIASTNFWESDIGAVSDRRLIVHATIVDGKEKKVSKIQLER